MKLPTNEELSRMSPEQLLGLWRLVREYRVKLAAAEGIGCMPGSAVEALTKCVDDKLMSEIVADQRRGVSPPSGLTTEPPTPSPVVKGTGWLKATPLESPPGVKYVDAIAQHFDAI